MDGRLNRRNKAEFSNFFDVVWMRPSRKGIETKTFNSLLFFHDIVDVDRRVRRDSLLGVSMRAKLMRVQNARG